MRDDNMRRVWSEQDLDDALTNLHSGVKADEAMLDEAKNKVMSEVEAPAETGGPVGKPKKFLRYGLVAAAAALIAVGATIAPTLTPSGETPAPPSAVAQSLTAAAKAAQGTDTPLGPGQYRLVTTHSWHSIGVSGDKYYMYLDESKEQEWIPADFKQDWLWRSHSTGNTKWLVGSAEEAAEDGVFPPERKTEEHRAPCAGYYSDPGQDPCEEPASWSLPTPEFLESQPRDPAALYRSIREYNGDSGPTPEVEMLVAVSDALRSGMIPEDLRASMYKVLARIPGIQIVDQQANLDGRIGTAYGISDEYERQEIIIDPETGEYIGERSVFTKEGQKTPVGSVTESTAVETEVVDGIGELPQ